MDKATEAVDQHDEQVDQGLEKAGEQIDSRTGDKFGDQIQKGVDAAQEHTGQGDEAQ